MIDIAMLNFRKSIKPFHIAIGMLAIVWIAYLLLREERVLTRYQPAGSAEVNPSVYYCSPQTADYQTTQSEAIAKLVNDIWEKKESVEIVPMLPLNIEAVYVALRADGLKLAEAWIKDQDLISGLVQAIRTAKKSLSEEKKLRVNTLEISLCHQFRRVDHRKESVKRKLHSNIRRGTVGLEIRLIDKGILERYHPGYFIASNRKVEKLLSDFKERHGLSDSILESDIAIRTFQASEILVLLGEKPKSYFMERGNTYIPMAEVDYPNALKLAERASEWMINNVHKDGRMTYKYWPSSGNESTANNMIRQWMATIALERIAEWRKDDYVWDLARKNIEYNLKHFYKADGRKGTIEYGNKVKLGSVALAALAIVIHPDRNKWKEYETALLRTIDLLWNEDGSFMTFYKPYGRNDNQNFYPGETLLLWAELYEREKDPELLRRFMKSFNYYRKWHLAEDNRNPAFIPWHTQAYYQMWTATGNIALKDFILEMNDWLLSMQQWGEGLKFCDIQGRFYDPDRPFGPPHSSSTGVYLEGLIDAYKVAREIDDDERAELYKRAIIRGIRSVMQLQFSDEIDMYYVSTKKRKYVYGGLRTTVYNNEIRCDNVQHNVMALIKIIDTFGQSGF